MLTIGMTGGIGSGKSAAAAIFEEIGTPVIDTDRLAHELTGPGQPALQEIAKIFGDEFIAAEGTLDRHKLRNLAFSDPSKRRQLEAVLHPKIQEKCQFIISQLDTEYCIIVVPLLVEAGWQVFVDRVLVVDCSVDTQKRRVLSRQGMNLDTLEGILDAQCSRSQRLSVADDIIYNDDDDPEYLNKQVQGLHRQYLELAREYKPS